MGLKISDLNVNVDGKTILEDIHLDMEKGVHVIFGPNGSGKTTLMKTIAGLPRYKAKGKIFFDDKDISELGPDKRSELGIATGFQLPPEIVGVKLRDIFKICSGKSTDEELSSEDMELVRRFNLESFLDRDLYVNFSGGEKKRAEILQLLLMKPKLLLLDEPDSGVDIQTLELIGKEINRYIKENDAMALLITHQGNILRYIESDDACVLLENTIYCFGDPEKILRDIKEKGYEGCKSCQEPMS